ncbi:MAG: DUF2339 domain-containing protein [Erythrobacter sp.]
MLEYLIIAVLIGGFALLWDRFKGMERRIAQLEARGHTASAPSAAPEIEPGIEPEAMQAEPIADPLATPASPLPPTPAMERATLADPEAANQRAPLAAQQALNAGPEPALTSEEAEFEEASTPRFQFDFEDIFGRRLPIWAGSIALAISGIFLVRYSIEAGLITPRVRVLLSVVFGLGLIAGAEAAYRFEMKLRDERVRQALAGAGLATLFGSFYLAGSGYGLIGAGAAFVGLAAVTAAAIALSHRFGLPCAIVGLVGGFAAPVLVDSDGANIPLLALYLALVTGGLAWTGQRQGRSWLGYAAMVGGLGWGFLMMLGGFGGTSDILAFGGYLIVLGTVLPAFMSMRSGPSLPQIAAGAIATLQMAYLVDDGGYSPLTWGLYLLIAGALAYLGWRNPNLRAGSAVAAAVGLWLLAFWPNPEPIQFALVCAAQMLIFAGVPLALQWRGKANLLDIAQLSAMSLIGGVVTYATFGSFGSEVSDTQLALAIAAMAAFPATSFAISWRANPTLNMQQTLVQLTSATLLALGALLLVTPGWMAPIMSATIAIALAGLVHLRSQAPLQLMAWGGAILTVLLLAGSPGFAEELELLGDNYRDSDVVQAMLRWGAALAAMVALWFVLERNPIRQIAGGLAAFIAYGLASQFVPGEALAWVAAIGAVAIAEWRKQEIAAWGTLLAIAALWALEPLVGWLIAAGLAGVGDPFMAGDAISSPDLFRLIAPVALAAGVIVWRNDALEKQIRLGLVGAAWVLAVIGVHSLYKGAWGIDDQASFAAMGMGERTILQLLLLAGAFALQKFGVHRMTRIASLALIGAALGHFAWFTLVLHNPLWDSQHVGSLPIVNWIPVAYGGALAALIMARQALRDRVSNAALIAIDAAMMGLIAIMAGTLLRQIFAGSLLNQTPIGQTESLLMSLLGIVLALAFLWWGSRTDQRSWRVGSLVLMLLAVLKVFLVDAAGLDGLLRIASFMALGFSLIGIGWFYTRHLKSERAA